MANFWQTQDRDIAVVCIPEASLWLQRNENLANFWQTPDNDIAVVCLQEASFSLTVAA